MADFAPNWHTGEYRGQVVLDEVEYTDTVVAGDLLKITGTNSSTGKVKVAKHTGNTNARYIVPSRQGGKSGDVKQVLLQGFVKVKFATDASDGADVYASGNTVSKNPGGNHIGFARGDINAANDFGVLYFIGAGQT